MDKKETFAKGFFGGAGAAVGAVGLGKVVGFGGVGVAAAGTAVGIPAGAVILAGAGIGLGLGLGAKRLLDKRRKAPRSPATNMATSMNEIRDIELEILYWAVSCTGKAAGYIRWTPPTDFPNTLHSGNMGWSFSFDSARKEMYRDSLNRLVEMGYITDDWSGGYRVTRAGYDTAAACVHEWWRRQASK